MFIVVVGGGRGGASNQKNLPKSYLIFFICFQEISYLANKNTLFDMAWSNE